MTRNPVSCSPAATIAEVAKLMVDNDCGAVPVIGDPLTNKPVGIITDRDIVTRAIASGRDPMILLVVDCMTSPAVTIRFDARLNECLGLLEASQIRRVIVVDNGGACVGIVAQADVAFHASKRATGDLVREVSRPHPPAFAP
jgi:CBS domain-containing protein